MDQSASAPMTSLPLMDEGPCGHNSAPEGLTAGRLGIWALIASEIVLFAGMFGSFILMRMIHPEWAEEARHLNLVAGTLNSLVLLVSNFFMMKASTSVKENRPDDLKKFLFLTMLMGVFFLGIKAYEYTADFAEGKFPSSLGFWSFYFLMTGIHAMHIIGGLVALGILEVKALKGTLGPMQGRVALTGIYWSFVEVVWIFLFPMLYLLA
ncbi:MAG TPA: cytochrome c oxidase subunit 3 [bacterium]|jgi:heme/copper-type cytochrome/quinol oxidase subunit 3|nr:cytochrome c oxidase subunit 3 [bacterium]